MRNINDDDDKVDLIMYAHHLEEQYNNLKRIRVPVEIDRRLEVIEETLNKLLLLIDLRLGITFKKLDKRILSKKIKQEILLRDNYTCQNCGKKSETLSQDIKLHIDHIIPLSKGGTNEPSNLRVLCSNCNLLKSNYIFNELKLPNIQLNKEV